MSFFPAKDPAPGDARAADAIDLMIVPRSVDVGHFAVRRALPHVNRRMVGPFIFFDHFGPAEFRAGQGIDVRPHPHIGLATVTFLFASRQPRHRCGDPTGRGQLDDRGSRHRSFRAHGA
jgi:redox-sensitive bicupin YhaK (pirin superfamily)